MNSKTKHIKNKIELRKYILELKEKKAILILSGDDSLILKANNKDSFLGSGIDFMIKIKNNQEYYIINDKNTTLVHFIALS